MAAIRDIVLQQIDLEISMKTMFIEATEARINWATHLQDAVAAPPAPDYYALSALQEAADNALHSIDATLSTVFQHDAPWDRTAFRSSLSPIDHPLPKTRPLPRTRGRLPPTELYVQNAFTSPPLVARLACSACGRYDVPTIQGLLNHCRLSHHRDYTSHDELVEACGQILSPEEAQSVIESGIDVKVVNLPSLRRLFQRAVDGDEKPGATMPSQSELWRGNLLSRSLGLHKDTPALAPFLGREPKRRLIHVYDDDEDDVDILSVDPNMHRSNALGRPRMQFSSWNESDDDMQADALPILSHPKAQIVARARLDQHDLSRFHVKRRVIIADRSLSFPLESQTPSCTHIWMISVTSPAYGEHVTTFVKSVSLDCLTQPSVFETTMTVSSYPFCLIGVTDKPFLAKVTLNFCGIQNPPFSLEQWVDVDRSRAMKAVLGEEQLVDVELSKDTSFLPEKTGPQLKRLEDEMKALIASRAEQSKSSPSSAALDFDTAMKSLLLQYPLIAENKNPQSIGRLNLPGVAGGVIKRRPPRLPYNPAASEARLNSMVPGRRKALEWRRAQVMSEAYNRLVGSDDARTAASTGAVLRWIRAHTPKDTPLQTSQPPVTVTPTGGPQIACCTTCGLLSVQHMQGLHVENVLGRICGTATTDRPIVDTNWLMVPRANRKAYPSNRVFPPFSDCDLVEACPPSMLIAVQKIMDRLLNRQHGERIPGLESAEEDNLPGLSLVGRAEAHAKLAPAALLSLATHSFIKMFIRLGLFSLREHMAKSHVPPLPRNMVAQTVLTPSHVLRGVYRVAINGGIHEALFLGHARLGTTNPPEGHLPVLPTFPTLEATNRSQTWQAREA
ncbi:hypothetical protein SISSUDRAFT_100743 [Sistotremastrum suecicum HHB10207 ss-3]|uniref:YEATS domain-containing protein n=1 Tax=Sistotremastrum suecicum HHB10207 ss-3 TaxID=1314776 RepID=A0A166B650_9AGAM|nr:hypothetical protein SISSUDRAFT_100743 [Sistotremastrum suecicum HHB10207 ss-3]